MAVPTKQEIISTYQKRAKRYNVTANLYYLIGFRETAYRKRAIHALNLHAGDTVVEIGCGTGLNFPLLYDAVGPKGKIVGVDMTVEMLAQAHRRIERENWRNVELVRTDASAFSFPKDIDGILSTFALTLVPEFDLVILNGCRALKPGKKWVILDFKVPSGWRSHLTPLGILLTRPFAVTKELSNRHPWESLDKHMNNVQLFELFFGFSYIAVGERKEEES